MQLSWAKRKEANRCPKPRRFFGVLKRWGGYGGTKSTTTRSVRSLIRDWLMRSLGVPEERRVRFVRTTRLIEKNQQFLAKWAIDRYGFPEK
jgi:hypothetical protein